MILDKNNYPCNDRDLCEKYTDKKCITSIICSQAKVSKCEAEVFCAVTKKLCYELHETHDISECLKIIDMLCNFFQSSACKEKSIAEVITSCKLDNRFHNIFDC